MTRQKMDRREWKRRLRFCLLATAAMALVSPAPARAQEGDEPNAMVPAIQKGRAYSPYAQRNFPTMVLFGDTHVHTALSADAGGDLGRLTRSDS